MAVAARAASAHPLAPARETPERPSPALDMLRQDHYAQAALATILVVVLVALLAPALPIPSPTATEFGERLLPPFSPGHILGTDQLGRDVLARVVWGARVSLAVGAVAAAIAASVGSLIGLVAGYFGGNTDTVIMRLIDVMLAFPYILLAIALVAALGPGLTNAMIAIAVANISFYARNVRGNVLALRNQPFVEAARSAGASDRWVLAHHILPNTVAPIVILLSLNIGWMITETAGLSFLGLGAQPPTADWGSMLADGRQFITVNYFLTLIPGIVILIMVLALNVLGDSLRDALDPRLRNR
jgi:peptide/nickel transport system permease protein